MDPGEPGRPKYYLPGTSPSCTRVVPSFPKACASAYCNIHIKTSSGKGSGNILAVFSRKMRESWPWVPHDDDTWPPSARVHRSRAPHAAPLTHAGMHVRNPR